MVRWNANSASTKSSIGKYKEFRAEGEGVEQGAQRISSGFWGTERVQTRRKNANSVPDSAERDVNSVAKDANSTVNADQENSRTAKSANSVRVKEESSKTGKNGSSDRGKDVNSVENAEQGRVSLTRKAKEERRERSCRSFSLNILTRICRRECLIILLMMWLKFRNIILSSFLI